MIGAGAPFIGQGAERFLTLLKPSGQPSGSRKYPSRHNTAVTRAAGGESVAEWFRRCVNTELGGSHEQCRLEDNIGAFAEVAWANNEELIAARIQVVVTEAETLGGLMLGAACPCHYFRLDLDPATLGDLFTHPFPHVHVVPDEGCRLATERPLSGNAVVDFIEFVYRHFDHAQWLRWAESVWNDDWRKRKRDARRNPFVAIVGAFRNAQLPVIRQYSDEIARLKQLLNEAKDKFYSLRVPVGDSRLLAYPT